MRQPRVYYFLVSICVKLKSGGFFLFSPTYAQKWLTPYLTHCTHKRPRSSRLNQFCLFFFCWFLIKPNKRHEHNLKEKETSNQFAIVLNGSNNLAYTRIDTHPKKKHAANDDEQQHKLKAKPLMCSSQCVLFFYLFHSLCIQPPRILCNLSRRLCIIIFLVASKQHNKQAST